MWHSHRYILIKFLASFTVKRISRSSSASRIRPWRDSTKQFSQGLPGSMNKILTLRWLDHSRILIAMNSGPLSERGCDAVCGGGPDTRPPAQGGQARLHRVRGQSVAPLAHKAQWRLHVWWLAIAE